MEKDGIIASESKVITLPGIIDEDDWNTEPKVQNLPHLDEDAWNNSEPKVHYLPAILDEDYWNTESEVHYLPAILDEDYWNTESEVHYLVHKFYEYEMDVENVEQGCQQLEDASNTFGKNQETATEAYMNALKALFDIIGGGTENPPIQQFTEICEKIDALKQALEESKDKLVKYANTIN